MFCLPSCRSRKAPNHTKQDKKRMNSSGSSSNLAKPPSLSPSLRNSGSKENSSTSLSAAAGAASLSASRKPSIVERTSSVFDKRKAGNAQSAEEPVTFSMKSEDYELGPVIGNSNGICLFCKAMAPVPWFISQSTNRWTRMWPSK